MSSTSNEGDCAFYSCNNYLYNAAVDIPLGVTLIVCAVFGIPGNSISCYYFSTRQSDNSNGYFFNKVYALVSAVGCGICIIQIPMIQSLVEGRRDGGLMYLNRVACNGWYVLWMTLTQLSIFLVAKLSISRLLILVKSTRKLLPKASWIPSLIFGVLVIVMLYGVPLATGNAEVTYNKEHAMCLIKAKNKSVNFEGETEGEQDEMVTFVYSSSVLLMAFSIFLGFPILPIFISCALSLVYLRRSEKLTETVKGSVKAQRSASKTVITVTAAYIIFNIPLFFRIALITLFNGKLLAIIKKGGQSLSGEIKEHVRQYYSYDDPSLHYTLLVVWGMSTVINSAVNPLIFYWRLKPFRSFVSRDLKKSTSVCRPSTISCSIVSANQVAQSVVL